MMMPHFDADIVYANIPVHKQWWPLDCSLIQHCDELNCTGCHFCSIRSLKTFNPWEEHKTFPRGPCCCRCHHASILHCRSNTIWNLFATTNQSLQQLTVEQIYDSFLGFKTLLHKKLTSKDCAQLESITRHKLQLIEQIHQHQMYDKPHILTKVQNNIKIEVCLRLQKCINNQIITKNQ